MCIFLKKSVKINHIINRKNIRIVRAKKGFTLIELLVVIAIIGVFASVAFVTLGPARKRARDSKRKADFKQINTAMEVCYNDNNCGNGAEKYIDTTQGANTLTSIGNFVSSLPLDPLDVVPYQYTWTEGTVAYHCLYVKSESLLDTWFCSSNRGVFSKTAPAYTPLNADCCGVDITQ